MKNATNIPPSPMVTILMGIHNGADHLSAQLDSLAAQTHRHWHLVCSDDGSTDTSGDILRAFADLYPGQVTLMDGPRNGFSDNYMSMIRALNAQPGYVCFADQDDIWLPDKISRGIKSLGASTDRAALYCGRHWYWYPETRRNVVSPRLLRPFSLQNALIENVASGNTILMNPAAAKEACRAAKRTHHVFAHDWWLYLLITGTGGQVFFDNGLPTIFYRQHGGNAIGAGRGTGIQIQRKIGVLRGLFSQRIDSNLSALRAIEDLLTPEARDICTTFANARNAKGFSRILALREIAPYRQRRSATLGFWGAASLGCI